MIPNEKANDRTARRGHFSSVARPNRKSSVARQPLRHQPVATTLADQYFGVGPRVIELTYTAWDLEPFAQDCGWPGPPFRWDEERRSLLLCELDAAFFHLYLPADEKGDWCPAEGETEQDLERLKASFAIPRDAVDYIMDTFPIVRRKDEEKYDGDYRTKRVILEIYDVMKESFLTGQTYKYSLDHPRAVPRCCHPAREAGQP